MKRTGLSCYISLKDLTYSEYRREYDTRKTQEDTWWLHRGTIPVNKIVCVEYLSNGQFVPYDFELHGRASLLDVGISVPSREVLDGLCQIINPAHSLDHPKALVMCNKIDDPPSVIIRGGTVEAIFLLSDGRCKAGSLIPELREPLERWVMNNQTELLRCWEVAQERYRDYYPD